MATIPTVSGIIFRLKLVGALSLTANNISTKEATPKSRDAQKQTKAISCEIYPVHKVK